MCTHIMGEVCLVISMPSRDLLSAGNCDQELQGRCPKEVAFVYSCDQAKGNGDVICPLEW